MHSEAALGLKLVKQKLEPAEFAFVYKQELDLNCEEFAADVLVPSFGPRRFKNLNCEDYIVKLIKISHL